MTQCGTCNTAMLHCAQMQSRRDGSLAWAARLIRTTMQFMICQTRIGAKQLKEGGRKREGGRLVICSKADLQHIPMFIRTVSLLKIADKSKSYLTSLYIETRL